MAMVYGDTPACEIPTSVGICPEDGGSEFLLNCSPVYRPHGLISKKVLIRLFTGAGTWILK
jgi:hypothetical protein